MGRVWCTSLVEGSLRTSHVWFPKTRTWASVLTGPHGKCLRSSSGCNRCALDPFFPEPVAFYRGLYYGSRNVGTALKMMLTLTVLQPFQ